MPYLHWGSLDVLEWRDRQIAEIEKKRLPNPDSNQSETRSFYSKLMWDQLCLDKKPLHVRRTLDQFYHTYKRDTYRRDCDQIVSKYGKDGLYWEPFESDSEKTPTRTARRKRFRFVCGKKHHDEEEKPATTNMAKEGDMHRATTILLVDQLWLWVIGGSESAL